MSTGGLEHLLRPGVGLWEEMLIAHRTDPNHCRITQQSEGWIDHGYKISVSYAATLT